MRQKYSREKGLEGSLLVKFSGCLCYCRVHDKMLYRYNLKDLSLRYIRSIFEEISPISTYDLLMSRFLPSVGMTGVCAGKVGGGELAA